MGFGLKGGVFKWGRIESSYCFSRYYFSSDIKKPSLSCNEGFGIWLSHLGSNQGPAD